LISPYYYDGRGWPVDDAENRPFAISAQDIADAQQALSTIVNDPDAFRPPPELNVEYQKYPVVKPQGGDCDHNDTA